MSALSSPTRSKDSQNGISERYNLNFKRSLRRPIVPKIKLIEDLISGEIKPGSFLLVEHDPCSCWYLASYCIAAKWIRDRGSVDYNVFT
jgi:hypothetical protein